MSEHTGNGLHVVWVGMVSVLKQRVDFGEAQDWTLIVLIVRVPVGEGIASDSEGSCHDACIEGQSHSFSN